MSEANTNPNSTTHPDDANSVEGSAPQQGQPKNDEQERLSNRLFTRLDELGVAKVVASFDEHENQGRVKVIEAKMREPGMSPALRESKPDMDSLHAMIENLICDHLTTNHPGWQNSAGAFGMYTLDAARRAVHKHVEGREEDVAEPKDEQDDEERLRKNLFTRLSELGVKRITAECEGGGDSGEIVSIKAKMEPDHEQVALDETDFEGKPIRDAIEEVVFDALNGDHPGWELDWGSDATYVLNVARREVTCKIFAPCAEINWDEDEDDEDEDEGEEESDADSDKE